MSTETPLLEIRKLKKYYDEESSFLDQIFGKAHKPVRAVDNISFDVYSGETLGLVGESGCGKSTTGQTILRLQEPTDGTVRYDGQNVFKMSKKELKEYRKNAQIVFQEPFASINPRMTIGNCIAEPLDVHNIGSREEQRARVRELLEKVGLSAEYVDRYAHEFSGGQCQRIGIARALALNPDFIVLDEPVSALDVSVQAQILNLLKDLQEEFGFTYLFIAHDLSVIEYICDRVAVMYLGQIAEIGPTDEIFENPQHPYTEALLENISRADPKEKSRDRTILAGDVPSPREPPSGCRFRTRCPSVIQPSKFDLDQEKWRTVMTFRQIVEEEMPDVEFMIQALLANNIISQEESWENANINNKISYIRTYYDLPDQLDDQNADEILTDACEHISQNQPGEAKELLQNNFTTICERDNPKLKSLDELHQSACHLNGPEHGPQQTSPPSQN